MVCFKKIHFLGFLACLTTINPAFGMEDKPFLNRKTFHSIKIDGIEKEIIKKKLTIIFDGILKFLEAEEKKQETPISFPEVLDIQFLSKCLKEAQEKHQYLSEYKESSSPYLAEARQEFTNLSICFENYSFLNLYLYFNSL